MPSPYDVYAKGFRSKGRAVLNPRRVRLQSGRVRPPIDVGDVVYDDNGQLIRLFNCLKPATEQDPGSKIPNDFEILLLDRNQSERLPIPIRTTTKQEAGLYYSGGVKPVGFDASESTSASITFSAIDEQGAILITSGEIVSRISPDRQAFKWYMKKHYENWCSLLVVMGLTIKPEDLMFITDVDYTRSWSNLVYTQAQPGAIFDVAKAPILTTGEGSGPVRQPNFEGSMPERWPIAEFGPNMQFPKRPHNNRIEFRDSGPFDLSPVRDSMDAGPAIDQVIFVRGFQARRRRVWGSWRLVEEGQLDDGGPSDNESVLSSLVGSIGEHWAFF